MVEVKILGTGCENCKATQELIEYVTSENDIEINLEKEKDIKIVANAFKAMAHTLRLKILYLLKNGELPVYRIRAELGCSLANTSQHLYILKNNKIIESKWSDNTVLYKIKDTKILKLIYTLIQK